VPDRQWLLDAAPKIVTIVDERRVGLGGDYVHTTLHIVVSEKAEGFLSQIASASDFTTRATVTRHVVVPLPAARDLLRALASAGPRRKPPRPLVIVRASDSYVRSEIRVRSLDDALAFEVFSGTDEYDLTEWRVRAGANAVAIASEEIERAWGPLRRLF